MAAKIIYITGTDTGVGKTVLTALLVRRLRSHGAAVGALKPICSGGRQDVRSLQAALGGETSLDKVNPWHFRAPLAPLLAARLEGKSVPLSAVVALVRRMSKGRDFMLVEGAGGLFSPLGEDFSNRELIVATRALPIVVCPNRLGALNQVMLVLAALPPQAARRAKIVLMATPRTVPAGRSNFEFLAGKLGAGRVFVVPHVTKLQEVEETPRRLRQVLDALLAVM